MLEILRLYNTAKIFCKNYKYALIITFILSLFISYIVYFAIYIMVVDTIKHKKLSTKIISINIEYNKNNLLGGTIYEKERCSKIT